MGLDRLGGNAAAGMWSAGVILIPSPTQKGQNMVGQHGFSHEKVVIKQHEKCRFDMAWSSWTWMQLGYIAFYMLYKLYTSLYDFIKAVEYLWINGHKWAQWGTDRTVDLVHSTRFSRPQPYHTVVYFHSATFGETAKSSQISICLFVSHMCVCKCKTLFLDDDRAFNKTLIIWYADLIGVLHPLFSVFFYYDPNTWCIEWLE